MSGPGGWRPHMTSEGEIVQRPMVNGRMPLYLTLLALAVFVAALRIFEPYSVSSPWGAYTEPAKRFLQAAVRQDSIALDRQAGSFSAVRWALTAARSQPDSLAAWARDAKAWTGGRRGDTADVLLAIPSEVCSKHPIWLRFVGSGKEARVVQASSGCFAPR
jgi:hypothetical protein